MFNEQHLKLLEQGVDVWNRWWLESFRIRPDINWVDFDEENFCEADFDSAELSGTDLSGMDLHGVHLSGANLVNVNMSRTNLRGANLSAAYLQGANLSGADLTDVDLCQADLSEANLFEADLSRANLSGANLTEADLSGTSLNETNLREARVGFTRFGNVDLRKAQELETIQHNGPSTIGLDTFNNSDGKISEGFLRGCGLSDWEIEATKLYQLNLTSAEFTDITYKLHELRIIAIQYYSCFISYSSKDEPFVVRLHANLQEKGVRCWFAPEHMRIGAKIRPTIDQSIRIHDKLLLILSEHSISSTWVEKEVETAFEEEHKRNQTVLFPVRLDQAVMETDQAWAADIRRTRHIGDFSRWKDHDAYQQAFERLLRDLKAEE